MGDGGNGGNPFSIGAAGFSPFGTGCTLCQDPRAKQFLFLVAIALSFYVLWQVIER